MIGQELCDDTKPNVAQKLRWKNKEKLSGRDEMFLVRIRPQFSMYFIYIVLSHRSQW